MKIQRKFVSDWPEIRKHLLAGWALPIDSAERHAYFNEHVEPLCRAYRISDLDAFYELTRLIANLSHYHYYKEKKERQKLEVTAP